jgi:hypothetical protein
MNNSKTNSARLRAAIDELSPSGEQRERIKARLEAADTSRPVRKKRLTARPMRFIYAAGACAACVLCAVLLTVLLPGGAGKGQLDMQSEVQTELSVQKWLSENSYYYFDMRDYTEFPQATPAPDAADSAAVPPSESDTVTGSVREYIGTAPFLPQGTHYTSEQKQNIFGKTQPQERVQITVPEPFPDYSDGLSGKLVELCRDDRYVYIMAYHMADILLLTFADGTELTVKDAVAQGKISGEELVLNDLPLLLVAEL